MANYSNLNPFVLSSVIEHLKINAPTEQLGVLRQVSTNYNTSMSKTYFDQLKKTIYVRTPTDFGMLVSTQNLILCDEVVIKNFTREAWDPAIAPIFRKIRIHNYLAVCTLELRKNKPKVANHLNIFEILPSCGPYITKLKCDKNMDYENCNEKLISEIISELQSLKSIVFDLSMNLNYEHPDLNVRMTMIENLPNPSTTIVFKYTAHNECYAKFSEWFVSGRLELLVNPIFFDFYLELDLEYLDLMEEIEEFTLFVLKHINRIRVLGLEITFNSHSNEDGSPDPDLTPFKTKMYLLSPYLTKLCVKILSEHATFRDFITEGSSFPKLKELNIETFQYQNLEFFKSCPVLEKVILEVHQDSSIFSNPEISDKENIKRCFGHLNKLNIKMFLLWYKEDEKIQAGNELCNFLKSILPVDIVFELILHDNGFENRNTIICKGM